MNWGLFLFYKKAPCIKYYQLLFFYLRLMAYPRTTLKIERNLF